MTGASGAFGGYVKTGCNNINAAMVVAIIAKLSEMLPNVEFSFVDEDDYTVGPLIARKGKARLDLEEFAEDMQHWCTIGVNDESEPPWEIVKDVPRTFLNTLGLLGTKHGGHWPTKAFERVALVAKILNELRIPLTEHDITCTYSRFDRWVYPLALEKPVEELTPKEIIAGGKEYATYALHDGRFNEVGRVWELIEKLGGKPFAKIMSKGVAKCR